MSIVHDVGAVDAVCFYCLQVIRVSQPANDHDVSGTSLSDGVVEVLQAISGDRMVPILPYIIRDTIGLVKEFK